MRIIINIKKLFLVVLLGQFLEPLYSISVMDVFSVIMSHELTSKQKVSIINCYKDHGFRMDKKYPSKNAMTRNFSPLGLSMLRAIQTEEFDLFELLLKDSSLFGPAIQGLSLWEVATQLEKIHQYLSEKK